MVAQVDRVLLALYILTVLHERWSKWKDQVILARKGYKHIFLSVQMLVSRLRRLAYEMVYIFCKPRRERQRLNRQACVSWTIVLFDLALLLWISVTNKMLWRLACWSRVTRAELVGARSWTRNV